MMPDPVAGPAIATQTRLKARSGQREVRLQVDMEASPFGEFPLAPEPLPAITDRVVAQQGDYWLEPLSPGIGHRIRFEEE